MPDFISLLDKLLIPGTLLIGCIIWTFFTTVFIRLRISYIRIRITAGGHVIIYKRNPKKPVFLGRISDIQFEIKKNANSLPMGLGKNSEFWFDLKCLAEKK